MLHKKDHAMQDSRWIATTFALLAGFAFTACVTRDDAEIDDEDVIVSELAGDTDLYKSASPM